MKIVQLSFKWFSSLASYVFVYSFVLLSILLAFSVTVRTVWGGEYIETMGDVATPTVVIDAGHGGEDVGAVGVNGIYEKDLNLSYAVTLGDMLAKEGYTVFYTRTEDRLLYTDEENIKGMKKIYDLKNRAIFANERNPSYFISLHMNHFSIEKYRGFEVYYSSENAASQALAQDIMHEVKQSVSDAGDRTPKATDDLYLLSNIACTSVLIECGFLSNGAECDLLCEKEYEKQLCFAIVCGIIKNENRADS